MSPTSRHEARAGDGAFEGTADDATVGATGEPVGVGPHPEPWPDDPRLDPVLLAGGDRRNVVDRYRYWRVEAIVADLDTRRHPFHVAIENWKHDFNIGTVVRNANAFNAAGVHVVGRRRWNRRGAMVTDRYLHVHHHPEVAALAAWCAARALPIVAFDNVAGSVPLRPGVLPDAAVLLFGSEGPGLSAAALDAADQVVAIETFGSTRSINAGVASGIACYAWVAEHRGAEHPHAEHLDTEARHADAPESEQGHLASTGDAHTTTIGREPDTPEHHPADR